MRRAEQGVPARGRGNEGRGVDKVGIYENTDGMGAGFVNDAPQRLGLTVP